MSVVARACLVALIAAPLAGCVGTHHGHPESRGPRNVPTRTRPDLAKKVLWHRVYFGSPPEPKLMGYLKTETRSGPGRGTRWVYDVDFNLVGWVSPEGDTTRLGLRGERRVGGFELDNALRRLWVADKDVEVNVQEMPTPRG